MKQTRRTTVVLTVLVLAGLAAAIFLVPQGPAASPVPPLFLEFTRSEVNELSIKNSRGEARFERDPKDRERWRVLVGKVSVRAAAERVEDLLNDLSKLAPKNYWPRAEVKPEERRTWGIEKPAVEATLRMEGRSLHAVFGARTMEKQNVYAEKEGDGDVFVVPLSSVEPLEMADAGALRVKRPVGFTVYDARTLSVVRSDGLVVEAVKSAGGTWELTVPYQGPADPKGIDDLVGEAVNVEVVEYIADGAPDLEKYGLLKPRAAISMRRSGRDAPVVLKLGNDAGPDKVYFMEEGEPSVYTCGPALPNAVARFDPAALRDRNLLRIGWAKIDSIEFVHPAADRAWKVLRVLDRWDVEKPVRTPAETTVVDGLLDEIRKAEVVKFLDGEDPAKLGLASAGDAPIRLVLEGVDDSGSRTLLLGKRDADGKVPARVLARKGEKEPPPVLLDGAFLDRLEQGWLAWRSREVLRIDLGEVVGLSRKRAGVAESFLREKNAWKAGPGGPDPDGDALGAALAHLLVVRASAFEAVAKDGWEKWGLGDPPAGPAITVTLDGGTGQKREKTLVFGAEAEGGGSRYARIAGEDLVFRLPNTMVNGADVVPFWSLVDAPWSKPKPVDGPVDGTDGKKE